MRVGDKKQATILGGVAVAAVGFLVFQLVPKGTPPAPIPATTPNPPAVSAAAPPAASSPLAGSSSAGPTVSLASLPTNPAAGSALASPMVGAPRRLLRDPFAELPEKPAEADGTATRQDSGTSSPTPSAREATTGSEAPVMIGTLPPAAPPPMPASGLSFAPAPPSLVKNSPVAGKAPVRRGAPAQAASKPIARPKLVLKLLGVIVSGEGKPNVAMVRIGERETTLRPGDIVGPNRCVAAITLEGVAFRDRPDAILAPGDEILL